MQIIANVYFLFQTLKAVTCATKSPFHRQEQLFTDDLEDSSA